MVFYPRQGIGYQITLPPYQKTVAWEIKTPHRREAEQNANPYRDQKLKLIATNRPRHSIQLVTVPDSV